EPATAELRRYRTRSPAFLTSRTDALDQWFDDVVASMVVFEDGLARKSEYRRFQIKGFEGQDDVRSMHEVIGRRFKRYLQEKERTGEWDTTPAASGPVPAPEAARPAPGVTVPAPQEPTAVPGGPVQAEPAAAPVTESREEPREDDGRPRRFAYPPQLVVVDGGQPQVAAAKRALDELGIDDIAVCGLAKRLEEVWLPHDDDPVVLPRSSEGLYLLQRIRDEAHRFAITYQRAKRAKRIRSSPLDDVAGLGETRKQALIKHFGSVKKLRQATIDEICEVPGIGRRTAESVAAAFATAAPAAPAVNTATGEIIEEDDGGSTT
ncbi:helix-hairpin-helix domain-containing protein, partial [Streptomyces griseus]|uniref:helix-hairpin-helix domain-containing protein n=1 Tax=Streptomyces griseus TaxID=1911 RepID=UPI000AD9FD10